MGSNREEDVTTKFRVDISELKSGITDANKQIKMANAKFKAASAGMDDWAHSTDGLHAKIQQLESVLAAEKQKLTSYQQQMQRLTEAEQENARRAEALREKHAEAVEQFGKNSAEAKKLETALKAVEKEQMSNAKAAEDMSIRVLNQQAAVNRTEKEIRNYNTQLNNLGSSSKEAQKGIKDIGDVSSDAESKIGKLTSGLAGLAKKGLLAIGAAATATVGGLAASTEASREFNNDMIKLEQNARNSGNSIKLMKEELRDLTALTGETDSSIEALSNIMMTGFNDEQAAQAIDALSGAVIKFPDTLKIESLADSLQETIKTSSATGQFSELIGRLGYDVDDFNEKLEKTSSTAERQQLALAFLNQSGLSKTYEEYQKANKAILDYEKASYDLEESIANLGQAFTPLMTPLKEIGVTMLQSTIPNVQMLVNSILEGANGTEGAGEKIGSAISSIVQNIVNKAIEMAPTILQAGKNLVLNLAKGIAEIGPQIITTAGNVISSMVQTFTSYLPTALSIGTQLLEKITSGIVTYLPTFLSKALDIAEGLADTLAANAPKLIQSGVAMIQQLVQGIMNQLPMLISRVPEIVIKFANVINNNAPTILKAGVNIIITIVKGIISAIPTLVANIPKIFEAILAVWQAFNWLSLGKNAITGIKNGISSMAGQVKTAGTKILNTIVNAIKNLPSKLLQIGKSGGTGIANGIKSLAGSAGSAAKVIFNKIVSTFTSLPSKMLSIGKNIVQGIWNGIADMSGWVMDKIAGFGNSITKKIKGVFGIHSPSRVMKEEVGKNIALGVGEGIKKYTFKTVDEAKKMATATTKAASSSSKSSSSKSSSSSSKSTSKKSTEAEKRAAQYKKDVSALETKVAKENASIARQAQLWDDLRKKYKQGTDERAAADKKYYALANKVSNEQYKKDVANLNAKVAKERSSTAEQAKLWDNLRKKYKAGTTERQQADIKYYSLVDKAETEAYKKAVQKIEDKISNQDLSAKQQAKLWDELRKKYKKGTDERSALDKKYNAAYKNIAKEQYEADVNKLEARINEEELTAAQQVEEWDKIRKKYKKNTDERIKADKAYYKAVDAARKESYNNAIDEINYRVEAEQLGAAEELKLYKEIQKQFKKGSEERKKIDLEIAKLENDARKEKYDDLKSALQKEKDYDRLSLAQEVEYWAKIRDQFEKGSEEWEDANLEWYNTRKDLLEKMQDIEDEYNENVKEANEDLIDSIQEVTDSYNESVKSRADAIADSMSLFDAFDYGTALSGKDLLDNLQTQVDGLEEWTKELDILAARGIEEGLLGQLQDMGPSALAELKALNELTDEELSVYEDTWQKKNQIATERATKELEGLKQETAQKIQELTAETNQKLAEYQATYTSSMQELGLAMSIPINQTVANMTIQGTNAVNNFVGSFVEAAQNDETKESLSSLNETAKQTTTDLVNLMKKRGRLAVQRFGEQFAVMAQGDETKANLRKLNYIVVTTVKPLINKMEWIGEQVSLGVARGIEAKAAAVQAAVAKMVAAAQASAQAAAGIHSPSRLFRDTIGKMIPAGVAVGIEQNTKEAISSIQNMISRMSTSAQGATRKLNVNGVQNAVAGAGNQLNAGGKSIVFHQTINSPKALSRMDIRRQTKNALDFVKI